jgi:hypothetical protein
MLDRSSDPPLGGPESVTTSPLDHTSMPALTPHGQVGTSPVHTSTEGQGTNLPCLSELPDAISKLIALFTEGTLPLDEEAVKALATSDPVLSDILNIVNLNSDAHIKKQSTVLLQLLITYPELVPPVVSFLTRSHLDSERAHIEDSERARSKDSGLQLSRMEYLEQIFDITTNPGLLVYLSLRNQPQVTSKSSSTT